MGRLKVLNLYACLGGNRYKWEDVDVTAVELDPELARMYQERFPDDTVIVSDAHQYLLDHYKESDFIWSSPPCPSHSRARYWNSIGSESKTNPVYPDMKLYEEIIFLQHHFKGQYVVENVIPYYDPLIPGQKRGRHIYWANFVLPNNLMERKSIAILSGKNELERLCKFHEIDLTDYRGGQRKDKIARNLVDYEAGRTILEAARGIIRKQNENQIELWG